MQEVHKGFAVRAWKYLGGGHKLQQPGHIWGVAVLPLHLGDLGLDVRVKLSEEDDDEADGNEPGGEEPSDGELPAHDAGVAVHGEGLEPLNSHAQHREEAGDDRDNEEAVDEDVLVTRDLEYWREGNEAVQKEAEGQEWGGQDVGVREEAVRHWVVDELGHEDDGSHDAHDKADGADNDVKVGECHDGADAEERDEESENEKTDSNNKMYSDQSHDIMVTCQSLVPPLLSNMRAATWSQYTGRRQSESQIIWQRETSTSFFTNICHLVTILLEINRNG